VIARKSHYIDVADSVPDDRHSRPSLEYAFPELKQRHNGGLRSAAIWRSKPDKERVRIKLLHGSTLDYLAELAELAAMQKVRVLRLWEKEHAYKVTIVALNRVIRDYGNLLVTIQDLKFNLGLDEYKRTIPTVSTSDTSLILPDARESSRKSCKQSRRWKKSLPGEAFGERPRMDSLGEKEIVH
jgi:hypothetical protein